MKTRTINAIICKKMDEWVASIDDEFVRKQVKSNIIVTGGCIASMLLREKVNDFDIYFTDFETTLAVAEYYISKFNECTRMTFKDDPNKQVKVHLDTGALANKQVKVYIKSAGIINENGAPDYQYFEYLDDNDPATAEFVASQMPADAENAEDDAKQPYRPVFMSANAITLSNKVQIVLRFYGNPDTIHENYDFVHCTNYWTSKDRKVVLRPAALECLLTKELIYIGSKYPLASVIRTRKFINRGWTVTAGQYLKMLMQLNSMDLTDLNVLEDQLTGVDLAYFSQVIAALKEKGGDKIDAAYLCEIIDRMF